MQIQYQKYTCSSFSKKKKIISVKLFPKFILAIYIKKNTLYFADERKWDAFVAFRSGGDDEDFVLNTLRPMLEDELGFSLCLHFRDFTPGESK